jgi:hypothetical protein
MSNRSTRRHFAACISMANSSGKVFEQPRFNILAHLFNHQTHHPGQAHTVLSICTGGEPPSLDMLLMQRGASAPDIRTLGSHPLESGDRECGRCRFPIQTFAPCQVIKQFLGVRAGTAVPLVRARLRPDTGILLFSGDSDRRPGSIGTAWRYRIERKRMPRVVEHPGEFALPNRGF